MGLVARRQVRTSQEIKRAVVPVLAGTCSQAAVAGKVDGAKCAVFSRWPMDGLRLERNWDRRNLCIPFPECQRQVAGVQRRRTRTEMAQGRQGVVLRVGGRKDDGGGGNDR